MIYKKEKEVRQNGNFKDDRTQNSSDTDNRKGRT